MTKYVYVVTEHRPSEKGPPAWEDQNACRCHVTATFKECLLRGTNCIFMYHSDGTRAPEGRQF